MSLKPLVTNDKWLKLFCCHSILSEFNMRFLVKKRKDSTRMKRGKLDSNLPS